MMGVFMAIGIVYGDIGTSPLYVMKAIMGGLPGGFRTAPDTVIGAISCIIWTLTIQTTVKYVIVTLRADNRGEGGILSLFALIRKHHRRIYVAAMVGAATLLADGIITPAITVTSAIEGLHTSLPSLPVVPIVLVIIAALFLIQPLGTAKLGRSFGRIMFLWFVMLGALGLISFVQYPMIVKAFNPYYALRLLIDAPGTMMILGAVFLCTTGAEALYSDLGHCGLKNIHVSWLFVKTTLILNYLGQGAWIITHPNLVTDNVNPFFAIMPSWFLYVGIGMATLAAIIASQALISGSFTIVSEAVSLNLWPPIHIKYPTTIKGQMFIPQVNYVLMTLCLLIVLIFENSSHMEAAYGLSITITMLMTTVLLAFYFYDKKYSLWIAIPLTLFFVVIETGFFTANMLKFMHGGWVTILIAGCIFTIMYVWFNGRRIKNHVSRYEPIAPVLDCLKEVSEDTTIPKFATNLVYVTRAKYVTDIESKIAYSLINKQPKRADTYWFVYLYRSDDPYQFGYSVQTFVPEKMFRIDIYAGFKLGMHVDRFVREICHELEHEGKVDLTSRYPSLKKRNIVGDFRFMVVERVLHDQELSFSQKGILQIYNLIKGMSTSDTQILDLNPALVTVEKVPFNANPLQ